MKIYYLKHNDIDKRLWDNKTLSAKNGRIYACSGWLDIASPGWHALVSENYDFMMPLPVNKKFFIPYIAQVKFTQQIGIFFQKEINDKIIFEFLSSVPKKYKYIDINLNSENKITGKNITSKPNHLLNLSPTYNNLKSDFSENTKRNIKKSSRFKLILDKHISVEDALSLKRLNNINSLSDNDLQRLENLIRFAENRFLVNIYGVKNETNQLISVSVFSFYKNRIYIPLIASSEEGKKTFASFQIFNTFITDYSEKNLILDFEGSALPGVARFFEGWGAKPETYYCYKQNNLPLFVRRFKK